MLKTYRTTNARFQLLASGRQPYGSRNGAARAMWLNFNARTLSHMALNQRDAYFVTGTISS